MSSRADRQEGSASGGTLQASRTEWLETYRLALGARRIDEELSELQSEGKITFFVPSQGEEVAHVAATLALEFDDQIFSGLRATGIGLARGMDARAFFAGAFGVDLRRGRTLPGLLGDPELGLAFGLPRPASALLPALGAARAQKIQNQKRLSAVFFGAGSLATSEFESTLRTAASWSAPLLMVVTSDRQGPVGEAAARAENAGLIAEVIDGDHGAAVLEGVRGIASRVRKEVRPALVELSVDYAATGPESGLERLASHLDDEEVLTRSLREDIARTIDQEVRSARSEIETEAAASDVDVDALFEDVLDQPSMDLVRDRNRFERFGAEFGGHEDPEAEFLV